MASFEFRLGGVSAKFKGLLLSLNLGLSVAREFWRPGIHTSLKDRYECYVYIGCFVGIVRYIPRVKV